MIKLQASNFSYEAKKNYFKKDMNYVYINIHRKTNYTNYKSMYIPFDNKQLHFLSRQGRKVEKCT